MFQIETLDKPESVPVDAGTVVLTHRCRALHVDPRNPETAVLIREMKGYLDKAGAFVDFGNHVVSTMDVQGLNEMLADTTGGKPAGVFRSTDIKPAMDRRSAEVAAAQQAKLAAEQQARADEEKVRSQPTEADAPAPKGIKPIK